MEQAHIALARRSVIRAVQLSVGLTYLSLIVGAVAVTVTPLPDYLALHIAWLSLAFHHEGAVLFVACPLGVLGGLSFIHSGLRSEPERRLAKRLAQRRRARRVRILDQKLANGTLSRLDRLVAYPDREPSLILRCAGVYRRVSVVENVMLTTALSISLALILFVLNAILLNVVAPTLTAGTRLSIPLLHATAQGATPTPVALPHTNRL